MKITCVMVESSLCSLQTYFKHTTLLPENKYLPLIITIQEKLRLPPLPHCTKSKKPPY